MGKKGKKSRQDDDDFETAVQSLSVEDDPPADAEGQPSELDRVLERACGCGLLAETESDALTADAAAAAVDPPSVAALTIDDAEEAESSNATRRGVDTGGGFESVRSAYEELGSSGFYEAHGSQYKNPHEPVLAAALLAGLGAWSGEFEPPLRRVLDLACGSGEASAAFMGWSGAAACTLDAADPFTYEAYERRMGRPAHRWSFEDIAGGALDEQPPYDLVLASFCLHLLERSYLRTTLAALARSARFLVVLSPHKRPAIDESSGWRPLGELVHERVRVRLFAAAEGWTRT